MFILTLNTNNPDKIRAALAELSKEFHIEKGTIGNLNDNKDIIYEHDCLDEDFVYMAQFLYFKGNKLLLKSK